MNRIMNPDSVRTRVRIVDQDDRLDRSGYMPTNAIQPEQAQVPGTPHAREPRWNGHWALVKYI